MVCPSPQSFYPHYTTPHGSRATANFTLPKTEGGKMNENVTLSGVPPLQQRDNTKHPSRVHASRVPDRGLFILLSYRFQILFSEILQSALVLSHPLVGLAVAVWKTDEVTVRRVVKANFPGQATRYQETLSSVWKSYCMALMEVSCS